MSDNMWNIFVLLLELNTIIVFLSGFIYFALIIRAKSDYPLLLKTGVHTHFLRIESGR